MRKNVFLEFQQARRRPCGAGPSSERGGVCSTHPHGLRYDAIRTKTTMSSPLRCTRELNIARLIWGSLPPEKWSSLMYGLWPDGRLKNGKEATHGGRDRHQAAAG